MNRIQWFVKSLALSLMFVQVGGVNLAQEKPDKPQDGPRTPMIDELWRQMGQLQRQIVGLEIRDMKPRSPLPGNIAKSFRDNAPQKASKENSGSTQQPNPEQKTVPGQEPPPRLRDSTTEAQIDQLWRQITELQKSILKLEIADTNPRLLASVAPAANGNGRTEKSDTPTRNPDRTSSGGPNLERPQKPIPGSDHPLQPRGGSNEAQIGQLWQQIGQLYTQIVALEVRPY
jgi:hypothetical protein